jgi:hypothetical protein
MPIKFTNAVDPVSEVLNISQSLTVLSSTFPDGQSYILSMLADKLMSVGEYLDSYMDDSNVCFLRRESMPYFEKEDAHEC